MKSANLQSDCNNAGMAVTAFSNSVCVKHHWFSGLRVFALACLLWISSVGYASASSPADSVQSDHPASSIEGDWLVQSRDAVVHIERVGDHYEGRIVWQLHDTYGPEDGSALNGHTVTDRKNPDPSLRSQPLTGLRLVWGLQYDSHKGIWSDGKVYDSDNGHTYHCQIRLLAADKLSLRGYIGVSLIGGNTAWSRVNMSSSMFVKAPNPAHGADR